MTQAPSSSSVFTATSICSETTSATAPGRTWVLLRGLVRSRHHWHQFPRQLAQQPFVQHLILPELAGNGERTTEPTPFGIPAMMEDVRAQSLAALPANSGPITLLAISMGAMMAAEWARCYPDEIAEIHLINTSFGRFSRPWQRMRPTAAWQLLKVSTTTLGNPAALEAAILRLTLNGRVPADVLGDWVNFARQYPLGLRNILVQVLSASRYNGLATAPVRNVFIYNCLHDQLVAASASEQIARQWQKPLHTHISAGHDLPLEDPDWLLERISQSVNGIHRQY